MITIVNKILNPVDFKAKWVQKSHFLMQRSSIKRRQLIPNAPKTDIERCKIACNHKQIKTIGRR
jgi:hypothetical protein